MLFIFSVLCKSYFCHEHQLGNLANIFWIRCLNLGMVISNPSFKYNRIWKSWLSTVLKTGDPGVIARASLLQSHRRELQRSARRDSQPSTQWGQKLLSPAQPVCAPGEGKSWRCSLKCHLPKMALGELHSSKRCCHVYGTTVQTQIHAQIMHQASEECVTEFGEQRTACRQVCSNNSTDHLWKPTKFYLPS